ncbi:F-box/kelch-repeat protein At3g23880-like isoform X2 [Cynara cardunculus var. scolymus]|uniref:F-box/kelch-repeat protein At3g23880-like isoform X2 n=1 Tax=Cynara cardunculus var. scolymus TaxID=59895 RepID=UPI000D630402|nr:F-box/kelch-repeat protein At3g23880-like isoform X2 [Cynara cardunculus var. scolymus]
MASLIPDELIVEILSRLPSKSLLRFRSVCKSWLSLISSTEFRLMHFHNFNKPNPRHLLRRFELRENKEVYTVHLDDQHFTVDAEAPIKFPFKIVGPDIYCYKIIGCCNGVVCLCNANTTDEEVILWNPSVRRNITLVPPIFPNNYWYELILVLGFGYDTTSDDYKVVRVANDGLFFFARPHVEIYTVKTAVWRAVTFPDDLRCFSILPNQSQVFFNGSLHWIACDPMLEVSDYSIMTFDMSTELFGEIQLPNDLELESMTEVVVTVVEEFLGVIYSCRHSSSWWGSSTYVIWAMKEYKNPATWTKMHTMYYPDEDVGRALQVRSNGDLITVSNYGDVTIYNREMCHYVYTSSMGLMLADSIFFERYQESLALLDAEHDALDEERVEEGHDEGFDDEWLARSISSGFEYSV